MELIIKIVPPLKDIHTVSAEIEWWHAWFHSFLAEPLLRQNVGAISGEKWWLSTSAISGVKWWLSTKMLGPVFGTYFVVFFLVGGWVDRDFLGVGFKWMCRGVPTSVQTLKPTKVSSNASELCIRNKIANK
jgi:hypothetical protein